MKRVTSRDPLPKRGKVTVKSQRDMPQKKRVHKLHGGQEYEWNETYSELIVEMVAAGLLPDRIAQLVINPRTGEGISRNTLTKHYRRELELGLDMANLKVSQSSFRQAIGTPGIPNPRYKKIDSRIKFEDGSPNPDYGKVDRQQWLVKPVPPTPTMTIWWEKTRGGMKEGVRLEHTGANGTPLAGNQTTIIILPSNGRETGATPALEADEWHEVDDAATTKAIGSNRS